MAELLEEHLQAMLPFCHLCFHERDQGFHRQGIVSMIRALKSVLL